MLYASNFAGPGAYFNDSITSNPGIPSFADTHGADTVFGLAYGKGLVR